jgi:hypothetical protein
MPTYDEVAKRLYAIIEDLVSAHPEVTETCKPGAYLRPEGDQLVAFMRHRDSGEPVELGRFPMAWLGGEPEGEV